jgi:site-specific DNA-methyltransferase (adenine-specific)
MAIGLEPPVRRTTTGRASAEVAFLKPSEFVDRVICGDSRAILSMIPDESANVVLTSPPYLKQRDYDTGDSRAIGSEQTVEAYIAALMPTFKECARVVRSDGSVFFNLGDKYEDGSLLLVPWLFAQVATKATGLKLINEITWVKPNPQPRQFKRRLVSATEPIFHFVKSNAYRYFPERFAEGANLTRPKHDYSKGDIGRGYFDLIEHSTLSHTEKDKARRELEAVIQEVRAGKIWSFRMKIRGIHSAAYGGYEGGRKLHIEKQGFTILRMFDRPMKRDVIETPIIPDKFLHHPAMFPATLVRECLNLTSEPGDLVIDPFLGSGTTAATAKEMGRHYLGIELNPEYCESARKRIAHAKSQATLYEYYV